MFSVLLVQCAMQGLCGFFFCFQCRCMDSLLGIYLPVMLGSHKQKSKRQSLKLKVDLISKSFLESVHTKDIINLSKIHLIEVSVLITCIFC